MAKAALTYSFSGSFPSNRFLKFLFKKWPYYQIMSFIKCSVEKESSREFFNENNGRVRGIHKREKCLIFQIFQSSALLKMSHKMLKFNGGVDFFCWNAPYYIENNMR